MQLTRPAGAPWATPERYWPELSAATSHLEPPFGALSLPALAHNAFDLLDRAAGTPIRVASKSVRCRAVLDAVLALPGYSGVLSYCLAEALWIARSIPDVVVGYPTTDRSALRVLALDDSLSSRVTVMVDSVEHLDLIDEVISPEKRNSIRVCIELDAGWRSPVLGYMGVWRSPVRSPEQARTLAEHIVGRKGFRLVGVMAYEAQIAGVGNRPRQRLRGAIVRDMQRRSAAELRQRRSAVVGAVRELAELEFVNGGGTGSIESTVADPSVTEVAAGSGLFGPHLFDHYDHFSPAPAAAFALSVVRKPNPGMAVVAGGGWIASGPASRDRAPLPVWPQGLRLVPREQAGEVQTPLKGPTAASLQVGDRVWWRHTKAGEVSEHVNEFAVVDDGSIIECVPTYRGEGKAFL